MNVTVEALELHSVRSAARRCGVATNTVRNWILTGRLPATRSNGRVFITQADLDAVHEEMLAARMARKAKRSTEE